MGRVPLRLLLLALAPLAASGLQLGAGTNTTSGVGCRTSVEGDACFKKVMWVKQKGMLEHPEWYHTLDRNSSFEDIQRHLHGVDDLCPEPCAAEGSKEPPEVGQGQAPTKKVLLVVAGLSRHFEVTWPKIEQSFLLPNEADGYAFKIIFTTEVGLECHRDSPKWRTRKCEEPTDPDLHMQRIRQVFAPRQVEIVDHGHLCLPGPPARRRSGLLERALDGALLDDARSLPFEVGPEVGSAENATGSELMGRGAICAPWFERVHRVVQEVVQTGEKFDRVVALRPDILINPVPKSVAPGDEGKPLDLRLDRMCESHPGFSFVTSSWSAPFPCYLHNRDLDFVHILCQGDKLRLYEEAIRVPGEACYGRNVPDVPPGFWSSKGWHEKAFMCRFVQVFTEGRVPIAHWDDTYQCDWPSMMTV